MLAIPSKQIVDLVLCGCNNVDRVNTCLLRQSDMLHQGLGKNQRLGIDRETLDVREQQRRRQQHIHRPSLETQKAQTWTDGQSTIQTSKVGSP
jgi:hypothetical protein